MERRKLFSENNVKPIRRKLFSDDCPESNIESQVHTVICIDCGYKMDTTASTTDLICPRCGGTSFVPENETVVDPIQLPEHQMEPNTEEKTYSDTKKRRKLFSTYEEDEAEFQREFSEPTSELESKLKEFSGKEISKDEFQREFSDLISLDELIEREYADVCGSDNIKISNTAYLESKLFSEIVISVTKELHLDPSILCCEHNKEEIIDRLEGEGNLTPKSILLLKKAHNIPTEKHDQEWINDSGIVGDLGIEFGGQNKELPEFKKIIDERYPDAPEDIMEILKNKGIIRANGNVIEILNNNN